jgi:hypothetical protein
MKPINECKTVAELLEDPSRWTKFISKGIRLDNNIAIISYDPSKTNCFCLMGALDQIYGPMWDIPKGKLERTIGGNIVCFNDAFETTHEMVLNVVRKAGI